MLLDNNKKLVETFMDNVIWGNVKIDWKETGDNKKKTEDSVAYKMGIYVTLRKTDPNSKELKKLEDELATFFVSHRMVGNLTGELKDRELEQQFKKLKKENKQLLGENEKLSEELSSNYKGTELKKEFDGFK